MPHISNVFRLNFAWRLALASFDISCNLSMIYRMTGKYNPELPSLAQRAEPDVRMMYELAITYFRGTLQPAQRTQITHYMMLMCNEECTKHSSHPQSISSHLKDVGHTDKEVLEKSDEDMQVDGNREFDPSFDEDEAQLTNEEWRTIMAQELGIHDDDEEEEQEEVSFDSMKP